MTGRPPTSSGFPASQADVGLTINLLGPLAVHAAGTPVALPKRRRSLLALLALRVGDLVTVEQLVDGLWGDEAPPTAVRTLHSHIARLGGALAGHAGDRVIERRDPGYLLAKTVTVDRDRFEELLAAGLRLAEDGRFTEAARRHQEALALWRGDALAGTPVYGWAAAETDYLNGVRIQAHEASAAARLAAGADPPSPAELERLLAENPFRERLWELLIVALQTTGRTADALTAYHRARRILDDELGIEPGEGLRRVEAAVLRGVADPRDLLRAAPPPARLVLPGPVQPLVGRDAEVAEVGELLGGCRLVTLTGFGGTGKTRLAAATAQAVADDFADVAFVDLGTLPPGAERGRLAAAVADALGVGGSFDELVRRIAGRRSLIILDNCEHLVASCAQLVHELLGRCPQLTVLATSQEALRLPGEQVRQVRGLRTPSPGAVRTAADLVGYPAVELFAERAGLVPVQALPREDAAAVAAICARCAGLPLALELAAARARLLTLQQIADFLRDSFDVLTDGPRGVPARHRAVRATVEWSYGLLTPEEAAAVRRICVFRNAFTLEAAAAVCPGPPVLGVLSRLVDKSLLKVLTTPDGMRYQLLDPIRAYALEQLSADPDERAQAMRDHARYFAAQAQDAEHRLQGPDLGPLVQRLGDHHDDLRAALSWLVTDDPDAALRLAAALWRYHYLRGRYAEGREWLRMALAAPEGRPAPVRPPPRAKASWAAARLAALECDYPDAIMLAQQALRRYAAQHDDAGVAQTQALLGAVAREQADYPRALELGRQAVAGAQRAGDPWAVGHATQLLGFASWLSGDFTAAARLAAQAIVPLTQVGDRERIAWCHLDLGAAAHYTGDADSAVRHLRQALLLFFDVRFKEGIAWAENLLALVDLDLGRPRSALRRLATALRLHTELGDRWRQASVLEGLARATALLGEERLAAEFLLAAGHIREQIDAPVPACERPALQSAAESPHGWPPHGWPADVVPHEYEWFQRRIAELLEPGVIAT